MLEKSLKNSCNILCLHRETFIMSSKSKLYMMSISSCKPVISSITFFQILIPQKLWQIYLLLEKLLRNECNNRLPKAKNGNQRLCHCFLQCHLLEKPKVLLKNRLLYGLKLKTDSAIGSFTASFSKSLKFWKKQTSSKPKVKTDSITLPFLVKTWGSNRNRLYHKPQKYVLS